MIVNRQRRLRAPIKELTAFLARVQRALHIAGQEVTVALVSDSEITRLNRAFRGKDRVTDVLSFPANGMVWKQGKQTKQGSQRNHSLASLASPASSASYLGDIAIGAGVARRNARRNGRSFRDELRVLILHGVLHLLGYDHETDNGQMNRLEYRLRRRLGLE